MYAINVSTPYIPMVSNLMLVILFMTDQNTVINLGTSIYYAYLN